MTKRILKIFILGVLICSLSSCISGTKPTDTYVGADGKKTLIETDGETCARSCNEEYSRCMDSQPASTNDGQFGPTGFYGASADCRNDLKTCLRSCKTQ